MPTLLCVWLWTVLTGLPPRTVVLEAAYDDCDRPNESEPFNENSSGPPRVNFGARVGFGRGVADGLGAGPGEGLPVGSTEGCGELPAVG